MKASGARRRASIKDFVLSSLALGKTIPELIAHAEKHDRFIAREIEMVAAEIAA